MIKKTIYLATFIIFAGILALYGAKITDALLKIGDGSNDATLELDDGEGANNAKMISRSADTGRVDLFNVKDFSVGRGIDEDIDFYANNADVNQPLMRYNSTTSKWQFSDNGTVFLDMDEETPISIDNAMLQVGLYHNFRALSAGMSGMRIQGRDGALSPADPAIAVIKNTGNTGPISINFESNIEFDSAGLVGTAAADMVGLYQTTTGLAWGQEKPLFVHACNKDNTDAGGFIMVASSARTFIPGTAANIGYIENAPATPDIDSVFIVLEGITTSEFTSKPCILIGGVRATKNSSDEWLIGDTSSEWGKGGRAPHETSWYKVVSGHNGAVATNWFGNTTPPSWANFGTTCENSFAYIYNIRQGNKVRIRLNTRLCGSVTNGTGGGQLDLILPLATLSTIYSSTDFGKPCGGYIASSAGITNGVAFCQFLASDYNLRLFRSLEGASILQDSDWSAGNDDIWLEYEYQAQGF